MKKIEERKVRKRRAFQLGSCLIALPVIAGYLLFKDCGLPAIGLQQPNSQANISPPKAAYKEASFPQYTARDIKTQIDVGPIDIHRKYRSMEGPYVIQKFRIGDLIASKNIGVPGSRIVYLDGPDAKAPGMSPGMTAPSGGGSNSSKSGDTSNGGKAYEDIKGLVDTADSEPELYWFRGIKLQVLDENAKPLPTGEFICHLNIDVDQVARFATFPELERTGNSRIITLTQGQTEFHFPEPYAIPVATDEEWTFTFQAANRTTTEHRVLKHRCTLIFSKDSELPKPLKALHWYNPYVAVEVDPAGERPEHHGPGCLALSKGVSAENMVANTEFKDPKGRTLSGHWTVPPGLHKYQTPVVQSVEPEFGKEDRKIHAVWTHVHPACTSASLLRCNAFKQEKIFKVNVSTTYKAGPELKHIDNILSKEGIDLPAGDNYELSAIYENPENHNIDSMVATGIFCESSRFVKPEFSEGAEASTGKSSEAEKQKRMAKDKLSKDAAGKGCNDLYCGIKPARAKTDKSP